MANPNEEVEYKKQLGLIGLQLMRLADTHNIPAKPAQSNQRERESLGRRGSKEVYETVVTDVDQGVMNGFAEAMSQSTFRVRIVGAFSDIVSPLNERLRILQADGEQMEMKRHHENALYSDKILTALYKLDAHNSEENRGIYLATKEFLRNPIWNTLKFTLESMVSLTKLSGSILFGFKEEKSDTDRIVDAINRLTEWQMNREIDQGKGLWERIVRQGIVGAPLRSLGNAGLNALGVGRDRAQQTEDMKSRGQETSGGFGQWFSSYLYSNDITKKGRNQGGAPGESATETTSKVFDEKVFDEVKQGFKYQKRSYSYTSDTLTNLLNIDRETRNQANSYKEYQMKKDEFMIELFKDQKTGIYQTAKHTKETFKEVRLGRLQAMWMKIIGFAGSILGGIGRFGLTLGKLALNLLPLRGIGGMLGRLGTTIVSGIGTKLAGLGASLLGKTGGLIRGAGKAAGGLLARGAAAVGTGVAAAGGLASKAGKAGVGVLASIPKAAKIGAGVGGLVGIGGDLAADALGRDTKLGAGADVLGQTATFASTGALIGSFIPGLGTAIGAAIGGVIGAGKGLYDNRETLFGANTPVEAAQEDAVKLSSDLGNELMEDLNDKSEETIKALKDTAERSDEMISVLKGILENTKQKAPDFISPLANTSIADQMTRIGGKR